MRFNEFNITEATLPSNYDEIAPNMRPQAGPAKPTPSWIEKSALNQKQDPSEVSRQEQPAYERKSGINPPAATTNTLGNTRPGEPTMGTNDSNTKITSRTDPTMGPIDPKAKIKSGANTTVSRTEPTMSKSSTVQPTPSATATPASPSTPPAAGAAKSTTAPAATVPSASTAPAKGSMTDWQQGSNQTAPRSTPSATTYGPAYRAGAATAAYKGAPDTLSGIKAGIDALRTTPPAPPAAKIGGPATQYMPPRTPEQAKAITNKIMKGLGKGMGSDANFYPPSAGQTSLFQDQQLIKDLEKELASKGPDSYQQSQLDKLRASVKSQEEQIKQAAEYWKKEYPDSKLHGQGQQVSSTSQSAPAPTQQAPAQQAPNQTAPSKALSAFDTGSGDTWDEKPATAPQSRSATTPQSEPSTGYKGTSGSQAIQQLNPNRITDVNKIYAGDTINLPGGGTYTIKQGDTLDQIARNQLTPSAPAASTEPSTPNLTSKSADTEKLPTEKVKETSEDKALNRIKSLAGLK